MMDCKEATNHLYELLDQELTPELEREVREHFEQCERCFPRYRFESAFARFMRAHAESRTAPPSLRQAILTRIMFEDENTDTSE